MGKSVDLEEPYSCLMEFSQQPLNMFSASACLARAKKAINVTQSNLSFCAVTKDLNCDTVPTRWEAQFAIVEVQK